MNEIKALKKFESLANAFEVSTKEMEDVIKEKVHEVKAEVSESFNTEHISSLVNSVQNLSTDFSTLRNTLLSNIKSSQCILSSFENEIVASGSDCNPKLLSAYSELLESCNSSIKLLSSLYKDISETHLKIKKLLLNENQENPENTQTNTAIIINTSDFLKKITD